MISTPQKCVTNFVLSQFSGPRPWYLRLHLYNDFEEELDCPVGVFSIPQGNMSFITTDVHDIRWVHSIHSFFFAICNGKLKKNRKMEIVFSKFCGREKGGVISGLILITFSTSSSFLPLIYLVLYSLNRQKSQILRFCSLKSIAFTIHLC